VKSEVIENVEHDLGFIVTTSAMLEGNAPVDFTVWASFSISFTAPPAAKNLSVGARCGRCAAHRRLVVCQIEAIDDIGLEGGSELERAGKMRDQPLDQLDLDGSRLSATMPQTSPF